MQLRSPLFFNLRQAIRMRLENLTTDPSFSSAEHGRLWFNSTAKRLGFNNGTDVTKLRDEATPIVNGDIGASAGIALSKLATDPLARANHSGSQAASTISDFHAQVRTNRLDQLASPTASVSMGSQKITGLANGTGPADAVNRGQMLDEIAAAAAGVRKGSVRAATTANITIATALNAGDVIDGQTLANGDRVLVKDQTNAAQNGIYIVGPSPARAPDMNLAEQVDGSQVLVEDGTVNVGTTWYTTSDVATLGTDPIVWTARNFLADLVAGAGLAKSGNTVSIADGGVKTSKVENGAITGAQLAAGAVNLGSLTVAGTLPIAKGGTGATNAAAAIENLGGLTEVRPSDLGLVGDPDYQVIPAATFGGSDTWSGTGYRVAEAAEPEAVALRNSNGQLEVAEATWHNQSVPLGQVELLIDGATKEYWTSTHPAGTTITIPASQHGLGVGARKEVILRIAATGERVYADDTANPTTGDVTVTFDASEPANSILVGIKGYAA